MCAPQQPEGDAHGGGKQGYLMQYFAEHKPKGVAISCITFRTSEQDEKASDDASHDFLRQRNNPGPDLVQIPVRENGKPIKYNMRTTGRARACLRKYEDSARTMPKPNILL